MNQNASLTEFIVGIPGEGEGKGGGRRAGGGVRRGGGIFLQGSNKITASGLRSGDSSDEKIITGNGDEDATLCEDKTIVVSPFETTTTTKRTVDSNSARNVWPVYRKSHLQLFLRHLAPFLVKGD